MPNKFAYLSRFTDRYIGSAARNGHRIFDEDLFEAYEDIEPLLVTDARHQNILAILSGKRGRRFAINCTLAELADEIESLHRPDLDPDFLPALARRLRKKRGIKRGDGYEARGYRILRHHRNILIQSVYTEIMQKIDDRDYVDLEILGRVPVPTEGAKSERALKAVYDICACRFPIVPAVSTMRNIVSRP